MAVKARSNPGDDPASWTSEHTWVSQWDGSHLFLCKLLYILLELLIDYQYSLQYSDEYCHLPGRLHLSLWGGAQVFSHRCCLECFGSLLGCFHQHRHHRSYHYQVENCTYLSILCKWSLSRKRFNLFKRVLITIYYFSKFSAIGL